MITNYDNQFSIYGLCFAMKDGYVYEYWKALDLPTTSCPQLTGLAINATLICHKKIITPWELYEKAWLDTMAKLIEQKVTLVDSSPQEGFITFYHPEKKANFLVPISPMETQRTDFRLLSYILKG